MRPMTWWRWTWLPFMVGACAGDERVDTTVPAMDGFGNGSAPSEAAATDRGARAAERAAMVERQIEARGVRNEAVLAAMRKVPREAFVPSDQDLHAYEDRPLPIGSGQTISQPYIVAAMTEAIDLQPGEKVLEIGTGSGYQAALLAEITERVFTIEIVPELAARAATALEQEGYRSVKGRAGDGFRGWPEEAPFDAIIVTAAPGFVPPALVEQLAPGGRLCIPVGPTPGGQELLLIAKATDGTLTERSLMGVSFVPMTGEAQR